MADDYDTIFKIVLVGDSFVGKTSLSKCCSHFEFVGNYKTTIGVDFVSKTFEMDDGKRIKLQIWDTAGQERYRAITRAYYVNTVGVVLVFDITDKNSFENLAKWKNEINDYAIPNTPIMVIGNKKDNEHLRVVYKDDIDKYCQANNNYYYEELSAKDNQQEVLDAFHKFAMRIYTNLADKNINNINLNKNVIIKMNDVKKNQKIKCCS
jgi:Ras-related protein Rab-11A